MLMSERRMSTASHNITEMVLMQAREQQPAAWSVIYLDLAPRLAGFLQGLGSTRVDDLVSDSFIKMIRSIGIFSGGIHDFSAWAFTITRNTWLDDVRSQRRHSDRAAYSGDNAEDATNIVDSVPGNSIPAADRIHDRMYVLEILNTLTPQQREVMLLRVVGDLTLQQAAEVIGESVDSVKQLQRRAIKSLKATIDTETPA